MRITIDFPNHTTGTPITYWHAGLQRDGYFYGLSYSGCEICAKIGNAPDKYPILELPIRQTSLTEYAYHTDK